VFCTVSGAEKQGDEDAKTTFQKINRENRGKKTKSFEKVQIAKTQKFMAMFTPGLQPLACRAPRIAFFGSDPHPHTR